MESLNVSKDLYRKFFVLSFLLLVFVLFLIFIRDFVVTIILAATFSGLLYPVQKKFEGLFKGHKSLAAVVVIFLSLIVIGLPLLGILTLAAKEAISVSKDIQPWVQQQMGKTQQEWIDSLSWIPFLDEITPYRDKIIMGVAQLLRIIGSHLTQFISAATTGTIEFVFKLGIGIFSAFFFLRDGDKIFQAFLRYLPLSKEESKKMIQKGLTVIKATLKSIFVIGLIQGSLISIAFWFFDIQGAVLWGIIIALLSAIPGLGAPLVWVPVALYLFFTGSIVQAVVLVIWGVIVVGAVDNFLRPVIIGKDVDISELLVLLSILGGLATFGVAGIIIGPVLASILLSAFEIYGEVFKGLLK